MNQRMMIDSASIVPPEAVHLLGLRPERDWGALLVVIDGRRCTMITSDGEWIRALTELRDARDLTIPAAKFELHVPGWPEDWAEALSETPDKNPDSGGIAR